MRSLHPGENDFLQKIIALVEENISNEQFGVSELADALHTSRSNLLRRVKKITNLSVSQLISQVRLRRGMELLRTSSLNVSEVAHQVGFSSTSYFIKCFREHYGYPPGEAAKRSEQELNSAKTPPNDVNEPESSTAYPRKKIGYLITIAVIMLLAIGTPLYLKKNLENPPILEKSIAVLPFINDSNDSTNVYLINGLMEATLINLQKIKDLKVISRTSVEKYRNPSKTIPEMAEELNVSYFVEGSGQKIGDRILVNIQLIDGHSDRHLWAKQYERETGDIFDLQQEIARDIAMEIQAVITPDEKRNIEKKPTDNLAAYDLFLKGRELLNRGGHENLEEAIVYLNEAIALDNQFALAHADAAIAYYYLDIFQAEKKYTGKISTYADKAILYDTRLPESLLAKAMFYMHVKEYEQAIPYLEKALEYNPNAVTIINFLSDVYANYVPNTAKYLEYALKGVRLDIAAHDSVAASYIYLHLGNALVQSGFFDEALQTIEKSIALYPDNLYAGWVKAWIYFARDKDCKQTRDMLIRELNKDTTRLEIMQDLAKIYYMDGDYENAYRHYKKFNDIRQALQLDIYKHEDLKLAIAFDKVGKKEEAREFLQAYKEFAESDRSIYRNVFLSSYYLYVGETEKSIEHLALFAEEDNIQYWVLLMTEDPLVEPIKDHPRFKKVYHDIETRFWENHEELRKKFEAEELL